MAGGGSRAKYEVLADQVRRDIAQGRFAGDGKLPTRNHFKERFGVSGVTVQNAFDLLTEEGVIVSKGNSGTFVSPAPPHRFRIGIVFPSPRDVMLSSKFCRGVIDQAAAIERESPYRFEVYYNVRGNEGDPEEDTGRFFEDVRRHRLGGFIAGRRDEKLPEWPIWREVDLPRVMLQTSQSHQDFPVIYPDVERFFDVALDVLVERGAGNIVIVGLLEIHETMRERLESGLQERGLSVPSYRRIPVRPCCYDGVGNVIQLLMLSDKRPDGLIVTDDNLLDYVGSAVLACGVRVPHDLTIVSEANFPLSRRSAIPAVHVGFDLQNLLRSALEAMERQRETGVFEPLNTKIPPQKLESDSLTQMENVAHG